jgi:hypothetical protein
MNNISGDTALVAPKHRKIAWVSQQKDLRFTEKESRRFWSNVDRTSHPGGCWVWTGFKDPNGYGVFGFRRGSHRAHRLSFLLQVGPIGPGLFVCHTCDNPSCLYLGHLFLGAPQENTNDMVSKGRDRFSRPGIKHHNAKLTPEQIEEIRTRYAAGGIMQKELAKEFGIGNMQASRIIRGLRWKHIK